MNKYQQFSALISKYALMLIILYLVQYGFDRFYNIYLREIIFGNQHSIWDFLIPWSSFILLNMITAFVVASDIKKNQLKAPYLILLTVVFRPLGICLLLISLISNNEQE